MDGCCRAESPGRRRGCSPQRVKPALRRVGGAGGAAAPPSARPDTAAALRSPGSACAPAARRPPRPRCCSVGRSPQDRMVRVSRPTLRGRGWAAEGADEKPPVPAGRGAGAAGAAFVPAPVPSVALEKGGRAGAGCPGGRLYAEAAGGRTEPRAAPAAPRLGSGRVGRSAGDRRGQAGEAFGAAQGRCGVFPWNLVLLEQGGDRRVVEGKRTSDSRERWLQTEPVCCTMRARTSPRLSCSCPEFRNGGRIPRLLSCLLHLCR